MLPTSGSQRSRLPKSRPTGQLPDTPISTLDAVGYNCVLLEQINLAVS